MGTTGRMAETLDLIRDRVGRCFVIGSCKEKGCKASMEGIPRDRVLVSADKALPAHRIDGKRCDCVLFFMCDAKGTLIISPIELKSGNVDASDVCGQLENGVKFAACVVPQDVISDCQPLLIHRKRIHDVERRALNRKKIRFRNHSVTIKTARCSRPKNVATNLDYNGHL